MTARILSFRTAPSRPLTATLRSGLARTVLATLCGLALVNLQWWSAFRDGHWVAAAQAQSAVNSTLAVLVIPVTRKNADDAEALERLLADAAGRLDTVRLFDLSPAPGAEVASKAADLVEEGLRAMLLRTPKRAQERLASAVQVLSEAPAAADERLYARLYKGNALAWLANNELLQARDALVKSMLLFPNQTADEYAAYGNTARELFETVKSGLANSPNGDLKVTVRGGKADIWVDGTHRGNGSVVVSDLPIGPHRVTVRQPGQMADRRFVDINADKTTSVDFDLKASSFGPDLDQGRNVLVANFAQPSVVEDRIRELRNQLGADQMLVVRPKLTKKTTELSGYFLGADGGFKKVSATLDKDENYLQKLADFVATTAGSKLLPEFANRPLDLRESVVKTNGGTAATAGANAYIDPNAPLFEDEKKEDKSITKKWWFWAAVVGGAALVGGGLYAISSGSGGAAATASGTLQINLYKTSGN